MSNDLLKLGANTPIEKAEKLVKLQALQKEIKPVIEELKAELLEVMQNTHTLTLKTEEFTISRALRTTPRVVNYELLKKSLDAENIPYEVQEVFADHMSETFKEAIKEKRELAGLEALETAYISIRIAKK